MKSNTGLISVPKDFFHHEITDRIIDMFDIDDEMLQILIGVDLRFQLAGHIPFIFRSWNDQFEMMRNLKAKIKETKALALKKKTSRSRK